MSSSRVPLVVGALVAAFLLAQSFADTVVSVISEISTPGLANPDLIFQGLFSLRPILLDVSWAVAFGVGVWVSLRWVSAARMDDGWRKTVIRGVIATALGATADVVAALIVTFVSASSPGQYPLGYSFRPTLSFGNAWEQIPSDVFNGVFAFIDCVAVVVLAVVLLKVWQVAQFNKVTAPVSVFVKP
jgi:hypothetical protein